MPAKTLYDLLCVRPDDDAETLQSAFRNAAKANHPDLNPGDPDAPRRFRQIVTAYEILRDAEQRVAYDRLLALERAQRRAKLTRAIVVSSAAAVVAFAVVLIGGYTLFAHVSKTSVEVAEVAARKPADIIAIQPTTRHRCIVRDHRGRPDTRNHSSQISARVGGEDAGATRPEPHASTERPHPHEHRGEAL